MTEAARNESASDGSDDRYEQVEREATQWLDENWDPDLTVREWWRLLVDSGWAYPTWPTEWFGKGLEGSLRGAVMDAIQKCGALPPPIGAGQRLAVPTFIVHGTEEQKQRFIPPLAYGEESWCQFFSEPAAGSDLAGLLTRADFDGKQWIINGQKVWTSGALRSDRAMLLARSDFNAPKHHGITFFVIDVDQPGIEIRPIRQMNGGQSFNEVFITDAVVPVENVIGTVNEGWQVGVTSLANERFGGGVSASAGPKGGQLDLPVKDVLAALNADLHSSGAFNDDCDVLILNAASAFHQQNDSVARQRFGQVYMEAQVRRLMSQQTVAAVRSGGRPGPLGSLPKLARAKIMRITRDVGMELAGAEGLVTGPDTTLEGAIQHIALTSPASSIAGGTDEIQKNILGERALGLPKEPQADRDIPFKDALNNAAKNN